MSGAGASEENAWRPRPGYAAAVRAVMVLGPMALAFWVTRMLSDALGPAGDTAGRVGRILLLLTASVSVYAATDRVMHRLAPLSTMLKLSLIFPAGKPSRLRIALRTGSEAQLRKRITDVAAHGLGSTPAEATQRLLELVAALNVHDRITRGHCERVRVLTDLMADELGLERGDRSRLHWAALLHDIGKLVVPAEILNKPGRLTDDEFSVIKLHPAAGYKLVAPLRDWLGPWSLAVLEHHERWDGKGYPRGLAGTDISLAGRIVAVTDTYDVITNARSYKKPMSAAAARAELTRCAGGQFDPAMVKAFLRIGQRRTRVAGGLLAWLPNLPGYAGKIATQVAANTTTATIATASIAAAAVAVPSLPAMAPTTPAAAEVAAMADTRQEPVSDTALPAVAPGPDTPAAAVETTTAPPAVVAETPLEPVPTDTTAAPPDPAPTTVPPTTTAPTTTQPPTMVGAGASTTTAPPADRPPTATPDEVKGVAGQALTLDVLANDSDPDGQALVLQNAIVVAQSPLADGSLTVNGGKITWTPRTDAPMRVEVDYVAMDEAGLATVTSRATLHLIPPQPVLMVSVHSDRRDAVPLDGAEIDEDQTICVFLPKQGWFGTVRFWLDDPARRGAPKVTENRAPYDYTTTDETQANWPCKMREADDLFGEGDHSIVAVVESRGEKLESNIARFTVAGD